MLSSKCIVCSSKKKKRFIKEQEVSEMIGSIVKTLNKIPIIVINL